MRAKFNAYGKLFVSTRALYVVFEKSLNAKLAWIAEFKCISILFYLEKDHI